MKTWMTRSIALLALAGATACNPSYGTVILERLNTPPAPVVVDRYGANIEVPAGVAVAVKADLRSKNDTSFDSTYTLDLISEDRSIFTTFRRQSDSEFVLVGLNPGQTCLEVRIDGSPEECIPVTVGQPAL